MLAICLYSAILIVGIVPFKEHNTGGNKYEQKNGFERKI